LESAAANQWSVDEDNREISSQGLLESILSQIRLQMKRTNLKKWLHLGPFGEWSLGHTNPTKSTPRDIAPWEDARLLSPVIDAGSYEQKVLQGTPRKLVTIWMYWTSPQGGPTTPTPSIRPTKKAKGKQKAKTPIKLESSKAKKPLATPTKKSPRTKSGRIAAKDPPTPHGGGQWRGAEC
jgi:hypothetical protein